MALMDQNLVFSSAQAVTASAASTNTYDIELGTMVTTTFVVPASVPMISGNATYFGEDLGLGRGVGTPAVEVFSGAGTPITGSGLTVEFRGAPMNPTAALSGAVSDLTFQIYAEAGEILTAALLPSIRICAFDLPRRSAGATLPRFYDLYYLVDGSSFSGLTVNAYINLGGTSAQQTLGQYPANF